MLPILRLIFSTEGKATVYVSGLYRSGRRTQMIRRLLRTTHPHGNLTSYKPISHRSNPTQGVPRAGQAPPYETVTRGAGR